MENEIFHRLISGLKEHMLPLIIACIGLILLGYGLIVYMIPHSASKDITFETEKSPSSSVKSDEGKLVVDVEGSVQKPGVYHLPVDARIQDALLAAGGLGEDADKDETQHSLNLAAKVSDGMKIYIPKMGETVQTSSESLTSNGETSQAVAGVNTTGLISINNSSAESLDSLPGVGSVTANKIINGRPYSAIDELLSKKIVGSSVFGKIKDKISL